MILTDCDILKRIENGKIIIKPFIQKNLGSNSYDVRLHEKMGIYENSLLDAKKRNKLKFFKIPDEGFILEPGELYIGCTVEYTETHKCVPFLEGKSSTGRLGISIHATAGKGDIGFQGRWTLEISVVKRCKIYKEMPIGQLIYFGCNDNCITPYNKKECAKYNKQDEPTESRMYFNYKNSDI